MKKRIVKYYKYTNEIRHSKYVRAFVGEAVFIQFGVDYELNGDTSCMFSTAIIELPDGTVKNIPIELIIFKKDSADENYIKSR